MSRKRIYLDHAATSPLRSDVRSAWLAATKLCGNPSSLHREGQTVRASLDRLRQQVASFLACRFQDVTFTSGATEANNLLISGQIAALPASGHLPHVVTSTLEHPSVSRPLRALAAEGNIDLTEIAPQGGGIVAAADVAAALRPETVLVTVVLVCSEFGIVQPLGEIVAAVTGERDRRSKSGDRTPLFLHTDAVQAGQYWNLAKLAVDALTLSAHKYGGPKGVGILAHKHGLSLAPQLRGGSQEQGLRAGTEAVEALLATAPLWRALSDNAARQARVEYVTALRDSLEMQLIQALPEVMIIGQTAPRAPHISAVAFPDTSAPVLQARADMLGVACSVGPACSAGAAGISAAAASLNLPARYAGGLCRFSFCEQTSQAELDRAVVLLVEAYHG